MAKLNTAIRGAQIASAVAGNGLEWTTDDIMGLDLKANDGLKIDGVELTIDYDGTTVGIKSNVLAVVDGGIDTLQLAASAVETAKILDKNVTLAKVEDMGLEAHILVANASLRPTSVAVSGDISIIADGTTAIGATKVTDAMINDDVATGLAGTGLTAIAGVLSVDTITDNLVETDIKVENESANCNGATVLFTLDNIPVVNSVQVFLRGLLQEEGSGKDYVLSGTNITFAIAPSSGDMLIIHYILND